MTKTVKHGDLGPGDTIWYRNARATIISIIEGADRMLEIIVALAFRYQMIIPQVSS